MPRDRRIVGPGGFYHVASRGNNGRAIYVDDLDRSRFLSGLTRAVRRHRWLVHAYCLMTNHFHLCVQVPDGGLSEGMQELNGGYSRQTNQRYGWTGHLFRNRFFGVELESEAHLLEACRYVVLNPVRARLCARPDEWFWSSYRACAGLDFAPPFLAADTLLPLFAPQPERARDLYKAFVEDAKGAPQDRDRPALRC